MTHAFPCLPTTRLVHVKQRRPEETSPYQLVRADAENSLAQVRADIEVDHPSSLKGTLPLSFHRLGSVTYPDIQLHCLALDGVSRTRAGKPVFHDVPALDIVHLVTGIITRNMGPLIRQGFDCSNETYSLAHRSG